MDWLAALFIRMDNWFRIFWVARCLLSQ